MASHVSQCMAKACMCDTWQAMLKPIYMKISLWGGAARSSPWEQQGEGGGREKRKVGKENRKGAKERRKGGKGRKRK